MVSDIVFSIKDTDKTEYFSVLKDYFVYLKSKSEVEAVALADVGYKNLIRGKSLDGNTFINPKIVYFDDAIKLSTEGYYIPRGHNRTRYKRKQAEKGKRKKGEAVPLTTDDVKAIKRIKTNLLTEYPALDRRDLEESVDNYCKLQLEINKLLQGNALDNSVAIKNLINAQISLGNHLGVDEGKKAKQKEIENQQSVAALAARFQRTLGEMPDLMDRMRYKELRILVEKYDRQELSKELFVLPSFAGISVDEARQFIEKREKEYE